MDKPVSGEILFFKKAGAPAAVAKAEMEVGAAWIKKRFLQKGEFAAKKEPFSKLQCFASSFPAVVEEHHLIWLHRTARADRNMRVGDVPESCDLFGQT